MAKTCRKHRQKHRYQQASAALSQMHCKTQASATVMESVRAPHRREPHAVRSVSLWASLTEKSSPTAPHQGPHHNRYRHSWHDRASARLSRDGVENWCCHAKLLFRGEVSLRAMRTGYLRLRMGSIPRGRAAKRAVRWEPYRLRCSALDMRVPSVGKLASWSRWLR